MAAFASWLTTAVYYALLGSELAGASAAFSALRSRRPSWRQLVVLVQHLVIALVLAHVLAAAAIVSWSSALALGISLWIGLSAVQWVGSIMWEKVPLKVAAIHGGDWLVKLALVSTIVGAWR